MDILEPLAGTLTFVSDMIFDLVLLMVTVTPYYTPQRAIFPVFKVVLIEILRIGYIL